MALNTQKCNRLTPLGLKGLTQSKVNVSLTPYCCVTALLESANINRQSELLNSGQLIIN